MDEEKLGKYLKVNPAKGINAKFLNDNYNLIDDAINQQLPCLFNSEIANQTTDQTVDIIINDIYTTYISNNYIDYTSQIYVDINQENPSLTRDKIEEIYENYSKIKSITMTTKTNTNDNRNLVYFSFEVTLYENEELTTKIPIKILITPIHCEHGE